jgi:uncharacterized membrane protein
MNLRMPLLCSLMLIGAMCGLSLWAWNQLPPGQTIAIHFDLDGTPNGFAGKTQGLLALPLIALIVTLTMALVPRLEPRREHLARSRGLFLTAWIGALLLMAFGHAAIVSRALGHGIPLQPALPMVLALFWVVLGTQLGRCQSTFFAGIRTPWTLSSEYAWRRTHELAGRLFIATGAITLLACLVQAHAGLPVLLVGTVASGATSVVASYFFWRRGG